MQDQGPPYRYHNSDFKGMLKGRCRGTDHVQPQQGWRAVQAEPCRGHRLLQAALGGLHPLCSEQLGCPRGVREGCLKIASNSPERRHGAIPGTFPPHPVTLLAKQS